MMQMEAQTGRVKGAVWEWGLLLAVALVVKKRNSRRSVWQEGST